MSKTDSQSISQRRKGTSLDKTAHMSPKDAVVDGQPHTPFKTQDRISIAVLILLYTLQGIPMGLSGSIPLILKEKGASYEALSLFSLVSIPFSLKLIWAPLVDCYYSASFGRRKTWLIPVQLITGLVMIGSAGYVSHWLGESQGPESVPTAPAIGELTAFFLFLYFLMATQDIAVDGWALTMLSRESVGYASICNTIGQILGIFIANQGFIALSDARWCHTYLGVNGGGLVTLPDFMQFWGYVFILVTVMIWVFKKEEPVDTSDHPDGLYETCKQVLAILKLPAIQSIAMVLLTCRVALAPADAVFGFKLQEYGMPKSDIATISPLLLLTGLLVPAFASSVVTARPMDSFLIGLTLKICTSLLMWVMVQYTPAAYADGDSGPPLSFLVPLVLVMLVHEMASNLNFIAVVAFFSKVSDPSIGGSYMTLLNTITNLGSKWTTSLCLYMLPKMTMHVCQANSETGTFKQRLPFPCTMQDSAVCTEHDGVCSIEVDGYTIQVGAALVIGILWMIAFRGRVQQLQGLPHTDWLITSGTNGKGK